MRMSATSSSDLTCVLGTSEQRYCRIHNTWQEEKEGNSYSLDMYVHVAENGQR